jgi:hypothetical protein
MTSDIWTSRFLFWTGIATMLPGLQFVFPVAVLGQLGINIGDAAGMFYARHWGLMALCVGALLVYASRPVSGRHAIVLAAAVEKLGLVLLVAMAWNEPGMQGLRGAAVFDAFCTLGYVLLLWRAGR